MDANHTLAELVQLFFHLLSVVKRSCVIVPLFHPGLRRKSLPTEYIGP